MAQASRPLGRPPQGNPVEGDLPGGGTRSPESSSATALPIDEALPEIRERGTTDDR